MKMLDPWFDNRWENLFWELDDFVEGQEPFEWDADETGLSPHCFDVASAAVGYVLDSGIPPEALVVTFSTDGFVIDHVELDDADEAFECDHESDMQRPPAPPGRPRGRY